MRLNLTNCNVVIDSKTYCWIVIQQTICFVCFQKAYCSIEGIKVFILHIHLQEHSHPNASLINVLFVPFPAS